MFDVFYLNKPTGLFPHERSADSIEHACEMSRTRYLWVVDGHNDYSQHDWLWEPVPWEGEQTHVWPSQHQENGGTYLVPKSGMKDVNRSHPVITRQNHPLIIGIDHGDGLTVDCDMRTRFISDYLGTLRRVLAKVDDEYVWVVSSVCDYAGFDFTWHPSEWQLDMLHVFPSAEQKFGDTFYVHVPSFLEKSENLALLEWFDTIHFVENIRVPRRTPPVYAHRYDTQVPAVWEYDFRSPVAQFAIDGPLNRMPAINLWRQETRAIVPLTPGASNVLVPREAKNFLKTQLYDYPVIDKSNRGWGQDRVQDIVFISNGETNADRNWQWLKETVQAKMHGNRIVRIDGVNGRAAAYKAALEASDTDWAFCVFAKLQVEPTFDWSWQPDRMQAPKHYIFHAKNPVNGLVYGHMAMIAYNKKLTLENRAEGLDFTLDQAHEVVPVLSGTAWYADSPWMAWRTAFREALKLRHSLPDVENEYRLNQWLKENDNDDYARWSHLGAQDAMEYYDDVGGDFAALKKSYEWSWLASYALLKRNLTPDQ
jgi:hypothetical protein